MTDVVGLLNLVPHSHQLRFFGGASITPQVLGKAIRCLTNNCVRRVKDRIGGAIVSIEGDNVGGLVE